MVEIGDIAVTPFEPVGLVKVLEIDHDTDNLFGEETCLVVHLHVHSGYPAGYRGWYLRSQLCKADAVVEGFFMGWQQIKSSQGESRL